MKLARASSYTSSETHAYVDDGFSILRKVICGFQSGLLSMLGISVNSRIK